MITRGDGAGEGGEGAGSRVIPIIFAKSFRIILQKVSDFSFLRYDL